MTAGRVGRTRAPALAVLGAVVGACAGDTGTVALTLVTAPGSAILDEVARLRLTLTSPRTVLEAARGADGFELALEVEATGQTAALIVEALDADGALVAGGQSPPFQVGPVTARVAIYVAPPFAVGAAPVAAPAANREVGVAALSYGAVLAGGRTPAGAPTDGLVIYNAFDHTLAAGLPLPAPRAGLAVGVGGGGRVYLFGGTDAADAPTGTLWRFDTTTAPSGAYVALADVPGFARTGAELVTIGADQFLTTGSPVLEVAASAVALRPDLPALGRGASTVDGAGARGAVFAGSEGITRLAAGAFATLAPAPRAGAVVAALPDGGTAITGDASGELVRVSPAGDLAITAGFLPAGCVATALVATSRHLVLVCADATHAYDATTLAAVASRPLGGTAAVALPNDQVLIVTAAGLALFTPPPG